jgi:hypothetical protein
LKRIEASNAKLAEKNFAQRFLTRSSSHEKPVHLRMTTKMRMKVVVMRNDNLKLWMVVIMAIKVHGTNWATSLMHAYNYILVQTKLIVLHIYCKLNFSAY